MSMKNTKTKYKSQKGQTLLFVIVAVTIAMAVGVAVSTRTIQSLKRVARTDTSARVIAAAEGGIENLLSRNYSQLDSAVYEGSETRFDCESIGAVPGPENGTCSFVFAGAASEQLGETCTCSCDYCEIPDKCPSSGGAGGDGSSTGCAEGEQTCSKSISCEDNEKGTCIKEFSGTVREICVPNIGDSDSNTGDLISSRAVVKVEKFSTNEGNGYSFTLDPGSVREVNLDGYSDNTVKICWGNNQSAIYYLSYNSDGDVIKGGIKPIEPIPTFMNLSDRFTNDGVNTEDSYLCKTVDLVGSPYGLRIKVLYNSSKVAVFPTSGNLPLQGYKLTSRGEIVTGSGSEEKATVIVHKSLPYASDIFDYGIYTPETLSGSN